MSSNRIESFELPLCPCCQVDTELPQDVELRRGSAGHFVKCRQCGMTGPRIYDREGAVARWAAMSEAMAFCHRTADLFAELHNLKE